MEEVFADTGYWQAIINPNDQLHEKAIEASSALGNSVRIVTTEMVLTELLNALSSPSTRGIAEATVSEIRNDVNVVVIPQTGRQFESALAVYRSRPDQSWSITDCASFNEMKARGILRALAYDKHFEQAG